MEIKNDRFFENDESNGSNVSHNVVIKEVWVPVLIPVTSTEIIVSLVVEHL